MSSLFAALRADGALDPQTWIVADARIDERETPGVPDTELILQAFMKWGDRCVAHLLGDFAFAIWNGRARRLFCARDHLGVKPLYYVDRHPWLLISSDVDTLRRHPAVSEALDDFAVADFLLFGHKTDPAATTFRDVRRVPPAHVLTWSPDEGSRVRRYWELPVEEPVYRKEAEYLAELRALLDRAVADRLRGGRAGVFFSGGLDSAAVAVTARRQAASRDAVRAFCFVHESLLGDEERTYAAATAAHLDIRCDFYEAGASGWDAVGDVLTPEPLVQSIDPAAQSRCLTDAAVHSPIAFTGEGADNALFYEWASYLRYLWHAGRLGRLTADFALFLRHERRLPFSSLTRARLADEESPSAIPPWIPHELVARLRLEDRWRFVMRPAISSHPARPAAWFSLHLPLWQDMIDSWHPSYTGVALDVRHPFLDLRLLRFLLSVPVIPWCREKHVLRLAFHDDLPSAVRSRRKTPLAASPERAKIARDGLPPLMDSPRLGEYASLSRVTARAAEHPASAEAAARLSIFSRWLGRLDSSGARAARR